MSKAIAACTLRIISLALATGHRPTTRDHVDEVIPKIKTYFSPIHSYNRHRHGRAQTFGHRPRPSSDDEQSDSCMCFAHHFIGTSCWAPPENKGILVQPIRTTGTAMSGRKHSLLDDSIKKVMLPPPSVHLCRSSQFTSYRNNSNDYLGLRGHRPRPNSAESACQ